MNHKFGKQYTRAFACIVALVLLATALFISFPTSYASADVFESTELKIGDTLGFVYYTSQPYTSNTKMRFTINGRQSESPAYPNNGKCVFIFNDIYPHELAKEITATIVVNGKETVSSTGLSLKDFLLQTLLDPNATAAEKQFASDTLQYGESTRLYRNANVNPADKDYVSITDDINTTIYTSYKPQDINSAFIGEANGLGTSASNVRLSAIGMSYHNTNRYVLTIEVPASVAFDVSKVVVRINGKEYNHTAFTNQGNGVYELQSDPINAYDLMSSSASTVAYTDIQLLVDGKIVQQASYSLLDYIYQLQETTQGGSLALKYARALYRYAESAQKVYTGKKLIAVSLSQNPGDVGTPGVMITANRNAQTPQNGAVTVYYSDGTSETITGGIVWNSKDIHGNEIKITDDTHTKSFSVQGVYTDRKYGKSFSVTGKIELHNDMISVARYDDPDIYRPTTYAESYTPTGTQLLCTWRNGYTAARTATHDAINMSAYKYDEYGFIPTTASYTDPKSGITLTAKTYLTYENPIKSLSLANTTANFNDGTVDNVTMPKTTTLTVTYTNNQVRTFSQVSNYKWNDTIQNGDSTVVKTYTFAWNQLVYDGYEIAPNLTATGVITCPQHGAWVRKVNNVNTTYTQNQRTVSATCTAAATNGEIGITFAANPSVYGGTVTSTANLTGSQGSTTAGQLSGGTVYMQYYNNAKEALTGTKVTYSSASITDTAYSKNVTVTANYTGKGGGKFTATTNATIYNWLKSVEQVSTPVVNAVTHTTTNVLFPLAKTANTIKVTYANGTSETKGDGTTNTTMLYAGTTQCNNSCYVSNYTGTAITDTVRTQAAASSGAAANNTLIVSYTDNRTSENYNACKTQSITGYKVAVRNTAVSFVEGQGKTCMFVDADTIPEPTGSVNVILTNGQTGSVVPSYQELDQVHIASPEFFTTTNIAYTTADGENITGSIKVFVHNPIVSVERYTDPENVSVTSTAAITESQLKGCVLTATYTNGAVGQINANRFFDLTNAYINDATRSKQVAITAGYVGGQSYATTTVYVILENKPVSADYIPNDGWDADLEYRIPLDADGVLPDVDGWVVYANGKTAYAGTNPQVIYPSGTTDYTDDPAEVPLGSCDIAATVMAPAGTSFNRMVSGANSQQNFGSVVLTTPAQTLYWRNDPVSATVYSASATVAHYTQATTMPTMTITVTWSSGAKTNEPATCDPVENITNGTSSKTVTVQGSYTANEKTAHLTATVTMNNSTQSREVPTEWVATFANSNTKSIKITYVGIAKNGYRTTYVPNSLTLLNQTDDEIIATWSNTTNTITVVSTSNVGGSSTAQYKMVCGSATYTITVTINNVPTKLAAYTDSTCTKLAPTSYYNAEADLPYFSYTKGNTTDFYAYRLYFKITYSNNASHSVYGYNPNYSSNGLFTCVSHHPHTHASIYSNGDTYAQYSSEWMTTWSYTEGDTTLETTFVYVPKTGKKSEINYYYANNVRYSSSDWYTTNWTGLPNSRGPLSPEDFTVTYYSKTTKSYSNGKSKEINHGTNTAVGVAGSHKWYWGHVGAEYVYNTYLTSISNIEILMAIDTSKMLSLMKESNLISPGTGYAINFCDYTMWQAVQGEADYGDLNEYGINQPVSALWTGLNTSEKVYFIQMDTQVKVNNTTYCLPVLFEYNQANKGVDSSGKRLSQATGCDWPLTLKVKTSPVIHYSNTVWRGNWVQCHTNWNYV